jgi:ribosomal protein L30E
MPKLGITVYLSSAEVKSRWEEQAKNLHLSLSVFIENTIEKMLKGESDELKILKNDILRKNEENSKLKDIIIGEKFRQDEKKPLDYYSKLQEDTMNTEEFERNVELMEQEATENNLINSEWEEMTSLETNQVRKIVDKKNVSLVKAIKAVKSGRCSVDFDRFFREDLRGWEKIKSE